MGVGDLTKINFPPEKAPQNSISRSSNMVVVPRPLTSLLYIDTNEKLYCKRIVTGGIDANGY